MGFPEYPQSGHGDPLGRNVSSVRIPSHPDGLFRFLYRQRIVAGFSGRTVHKKRIEHKNSDFRNIPEILNFKFEKICRIIKKFINKKDFLIFLLYIKSLILRFKKI